jgi:hypothetical protein
LVLVRFFQPCYEGPSWFDSDECIVSVIQRQRFRRARFVTISGCSIPRIEFIWVRFEGAGNF